MQLFVLVKGAGRLLGREYDKVGHGRLCDVVLQPLVDNQVRLAVRAIDAIATLELLVAGAVHAVRAKEHFAFIF